MKLICSVSPKGPNRLHGRHWSSRHKHKKLVREALYLENEELRRLARGVTRYWPVPPPIRVTYTRLYARQPMDPDNNAASIKVVLDALQDLGVIEDDGPKVIEELTCKQTKVKTVKEEGFTVELTTIEEK